MAKEIERKFRVHDREVESLKLDNYPYKLVNQKYIMLTDNEELRLRMTKDYEDNVEYILTIKKGRGEVRDEISIEINKEQAHALYRLDDHPPLIKKRYEIPYEGKIIELDVFYELWLNVAEIEFKSKEEMDYFNYPDWFGKPTYLKNRDIYEDIWEYERRYRR